MSHLFLVFKTKSCERMHIHTPSTHININRIHLLTIGLEPACNCVLLLSFLFPSFLLHSARHSNNKYARFHSLIHIHRIHRINKKRRAYTRSETVSVNEIFKTTRRSILRRFWKVQMHIAITFDDVMWYSAVRCGAAYSLLFTRDFNLGNIRIYIL